MNEDEYSYLKDLETQNRMNKLDMANLSNLANSTISSSQQTNLIEWQLELDNILEKMDHILRGHVLVFEDGNVNWEKPKDEGRIIFSEYGVQEILGILSMYLNRNTILSNYDETQINDKVYDFSIEIIELINNKYEDIFYEPSTAYSRKVLYKFLKEHPKELEKCLEDREYFLRKLEDTRHDLRYERIKAYPVIVRWIVDSVHSAYNRALNGGERESLRKIMTVTQTDPMNNNNMSNQLNKKFSIVNPRSWFSR